jgi:hypothetical protein
MDAMPMERDEIAVMFIRTPDDVEAFGPAFERLEQLVGLRGRSTTAPSIHASRSTGPAS